MKDFLFNKWTCKNIIVSLLCLTSSVLYTGMDPGPETGLLCGSRRSCSPQNALQPPGCLLCWADKVAVTPCPEPSWFYIQL